MNILFWIITSFLILNGIFFILGSLPIGIASFDPIGLAFGFLSLVWSIFRIQKFQRMRNAGYKYIREYNQHLKAKNAGFDSIEAYSEFKLLEASRKAEERAKKQALRAAKKAEREKERARKKAESEKERARKKAERERIQLRARSRWKAALQQQGVSQSDINTVIRRYGHGPHGWLGPNTNGNPSEEGLMKLPGIGKVTANKIMAVGRLGWMDKD